MQSSGNQSGSSQPTNIKKVNDSYLKDKGFDAHEIKEGIMGKKNGSKYDIYVDNDTGQLWVFRKGGIGEGTPTGDYIK
ncbi:hypothetical protein HCB51_16520 [Listeria booriae]|nr:hypothetical protein [Listeria booriae]